MAFRKLPENRLTDEERDILNLRENEGWSYKKIGEKYGVQPEGIRQKIFNARVRQRKIWIEKLGPKMGIEPIDLMGKLEKIFWVDKVKMDGALLYLLHEHGIDPEV